MAELCQGVMPEEFQSLGRGLVMISKMRDVIRTSAVASALLWTATLSSGSAIAATLNVVDDLDDTNGSGGSYISIMCDCFGYDYNYAPSLTTTEAVASSGGSDSSIISAFSSLSGISESLISVAYKIEDDADGIADNLLSLDILSGMTYFVKKADYFAFFTATGDGQATFSSSISNGGELSAVPLPAAGWLLLAGLAGLVTMGRRRATG